MPSSKARGAYGKGSGKSTGKGKSRTDKGKRKTKSGLGCRRSRFLICERLAMAHWNALRGGFGSGKGRYFVEGIQAENVQHGAYRVKRLRMKR